MDNLKLDKEVVLERDGLCFEKILLPAKSIIVDLKSEICLDYIVFSMMSFPLEKYESLLPDCFFFFFFFSMKMIYTRH